MSVKLLLYCTKAKPYLIYDYYDNHCDKCFLTDEILNGKIVAECECEKVEEIICSKISNGVGFDAIYDTCELLANELHKKSCLNDWHLEDYFGVKDNEPVGYALHLSNVKVFDEPKELGKREYVHYDRIHLEEPRIKFSVLKPLTNMMYVYDNQGTEYILIPVQSEHLCKILNGEKTIDVRKKVLNSLKEMLEDD